MRIDIDTAALERAASMVESVAGDVSSQGNAIASLGGNVSAVWQSQYTQSFNESFSVVQDRLNKVSANLSNIAQQLRNTAGEIERVERENAARLGGGSGAFGGGGGGSR